MPEPLSGFIRVRDDLLDPWVAAFRGGKDGMITQDFGDGDVALIFGYDRHCILQDCQCVGPELWNISELNLATLER